MPLPSSRRAGRTYDRLSGWYDWLARSEQRLVRQGAESLALRPGESALEIGSGTGHGLLALGQAVGPPGRVTGIDLSPGMLARSRQRVARAGLAPVVGLVCADGARLPVLHGSFDAAFLAFTLELFAAPEVPVVLAECRRVLRPGGRIAVVSLARQGGSRTMLRLYRWANVRFPAWVDCRPIDPAQALQVGGFCLAATSQHTLWGLPVQIAVAAVA